MLCLHYKMRPCDVEDLTLIQYDILISTLNTHLERESQAVGHA